ncbi:hypothetical protein QYE76_001796 [Lolium multiflorum]|uniref:RNase H type-1 domain-containing protein n=1 Tax=Lolium multiflorum TaxID=4521 RepID=A0AAD8W011_LOLMU|nr:hypothetical protein QYE76_001796 [Lolium multiflorum]
MHFDGSKQHQGSGTLKSPTGEEPQYVLQIHFEATNNMEEYEALLHGLRIAKEIGIKHIICCGDSDPVATNSRNLERPKLRHGGLQRRIDEIAKCFLGYEVKYVRRDDNTAADMLSKLDPGRKQLPEDEVLARQIISPCFLTTSSTIHREFPPTMKKMLTRLVSVDLIEEARNLADQRSTIYQQKLTALCGRQVERLLHGRRPGPPPS